MAGQQQHGQVRGHLQEEGGQAGEGLHKALHLGGLIGRATLNMIRNSTRTGRRLVQQ